MILDKPSGMLSSLSRTTEMALETQPNIVIFLRPDLIYYDSFAAVLEKAATVEDRSVYTSPATTRRD